MHRFVIVLLALGLDGCSQFDVRSSHDPNASFAALKTYAWLPLAEVAPADQRVLDRAIDARIRADVDIELRAKGCRPAEGAAPDFLLNYRLASEPAEVVKGNPGRYFYGLEWSGWSGAEALYTDRYDAGKLYLAVIDPRSRRMIWLGVANARLLPHASFEKRTKRVDAAVHEILAGFPPA
jgi:hypothetical protein